MKKRAKYVYLAVLTPTLLIFTVTYVHRFEAVMPSVGEDTLLLLIPDNVDSKIAAVQEWVDAANEEGLHLQPIHDSEFLNPLAKVHAVGVILPDQLHRSANDVLIGELYQYVRAGGNLMVVYDACTLDLNGRFPPGDARLSSLVGIRYGLYDLYTTATMTSALVTGTSATMRQIGIPPGSFAQVDERGKLSRWRSVSERKETDDEQEARFAFAAYQYGAIDYPMFRTLGTFDGTVLLRSKHGLAAGYRQEDLGQVLFVNLPLGYLESRTDGLLLHSFLRFFGVHMIGLPRMSSVPDGIGGLVFNWHIDAASSLRPLKILADEGVFDHGKFSVHFTAGPDVNEFGDRKGLDILHNPEAQKWIHYLLARGDTIGSHGGWIHNYFGYHVSDDNQQSFQKYLEMNKDAVEHVAGTRIVEYSAPVGNHPTWVTRWLEAHGFIAYYFTGDAGLGPTRVYRDGHPDSPGIWGFPVLHMGKEASLEEMGFDDVPTGAVRDWLLAVTEFASREHTARLVYAHPFGAERFFPTLRNWLNNADSAQRAGRFRWYTMTELAKFLNQRSSVQWSLLPKAAGKVILHASHPESLARQAWEFPESTYQKPRVVQGAANIREQDGMIIVVATGGRQLKVEFEQKGELRHPTSETIEAKR
ncbi:MAG TPA: hypothetical protein VJO35_15940 [Terriglobales bacterium]|nr:hypothetical protein [Terriglobales bacterium]